MQIFFRTYAEKSVAEAIYRLSCGAPLCLIALYECSSVLNFILSSLNQAFRIEYLHTLVYHIVSSLFLIHLFFVPQSMLVCFTFNYYIILHRLKRIIVFKTERSPVEDFLQSKIMHVSIIFQKSLSIYFRSYSSKLLHEIIQNV